MLVNICGGGREGEMGGGRGRREGRGDGREEWDISIGQYTYVTGQAKTRTSAQLLIL